MKGKWKNICSLMGIKLTIFRFFFEKLESRTRTLSFKKKKISKIKKRNTKKKFFLYTCLDLPGT